MNLLTGTVFVTILIWSADARSVRHQNLISKTMLSSNFIGVSTNDLATAMLQASVDEDSNYVFSPIGYSTILAMLAEGARGDTRNQLAAALHFPEDTLAVRSTYRNLLTHMEGKGPNRPEFKNWFYVYKNYSIDVDYMKNLAQYYRTDVKAVEWDFYENVNQEGDLLAEEKKKEEDKKKQPEDDNKKQEQQENSVEDKKEEGEKVPSTNQEKVQEQVVNEVTTEFVEKNEVPQSDAVPDVQEEKVVEKEEDKEKVTEVPEKVTQDEAKRTEKTPEEVVTPSTTEGTDGKDQTVSPVKENSVDTSVNKESAAEAEAAEENRVEPTKGKKKASRHHKKGSRYFVNKDTVTSLTANRLTSSKKLKEGETGSKKIIIFNGFYYQGNWSVRFASAEGESEFETCTGERKPVKMMHASGEFETGRVPDLRATALELPYQGDRYSLLVLLPDEKTSLKDLANNLIDYNLANIDYFLKKKTVEVCLPKANFYTISKPKPALIKRGVKDLFSKEADLSGINSDKELYLDELVQLVTLHFEESSTATNFLTSSLSTTRSNTEQFKANRPFFFFLRDRQDGVVLAAGKLQDPTKSSESQ